MIRVSPERTSGKDPDMTAIKWQKTWFRILSTVLVAGMMMLIFAFSTQTAEASDETSGGISRIVIRVFIPDFSRETPEKQTEIYDTVQFYVRKVAHFAEYLLLGFLMRFCLLSWFGKRTWLTIGSWGAGTLYALTDEIHQMMIDGRSGQWTDVLLDSAGVLAGVLIAAKLVELTERKAGRSK